MIFYIPLEHIDMRYTSHLDRDIVAYLREKAIPYKRIYPQLEGGNSLPEGLFLNAPFTCKFKSAQLQYIAALFESDQIKDGDTIWFSDIWFPGIEQIAYMKYFTKKPNVKIKGFLHAGSFTDTDFVRDMERWAKNFEEIIFDISDEIFVASQFIKNDVIKKRLIDPNKLTVTGLPIDQKEMDKFANSNFRRPTVIFNGRNCDEKQPHLFDRLRNEVQSKYPEVEFINTQHANLSKEKYYSLLSESMVVVSYALQENFGFGIAEAVYLGCVPIVPNRLVYPELYPKECLYSDYNNSVKLVEDALVGLIKPIKRSDMKFLGSCFDKWFKE